MESTPAPVGAHFCFPHVAQFIVEQKMSMTSRGKFEIKDPEGKVLFQVKHKLPSLHNKRVLSDANGEQILVLTQKWNIHETWEATSEKEGGRVLFTLRKPKFLELKPSFNVYVGSGTDRDPDFTAKGDFLDYNYAIYHKDVIVAQASKKVTTSGVLLAIDQYVLTVQPNVDHAFIATLIVGLDQIAQPGL